MAISRVSFGHVAGRRGGRFLQVAPGTGGAGAAPIAAPAERIRRPPRFDAKA
jgi:hypothetical protein